MTLTPEQHDLRRAIRAQLDSARLLVDLTEQAFHGDLPVLDWRITTVGLVGRHDPLATPEQRQSAFDAWAEHLGATVDPPVEQIHVPSRYLRAETRIPHPQASTGTVRVTLVAEIEHEEAVELEKES